MVIYETGFSVLVLNNLKHSFCFVLFPFCSSWFSVFVKKYRYVFGFESDVVFYFSYLGFGLSSTWAAIMRLHWSRIAAKTSACSACHNCIGSIWVLITGMWIFTGFHGFASGFRFGSNFVYAVCGLDRIFCTQQPAVFYDYWTGLNWQRIDVASLLLAGPQNFFNSYNLFCRRSLPFLVHANCDVLDV